MTARTPKKHLAVLSGILGSHFLLSLQSRPFHAATPAQGPNRPMEVSGGGPEYGKAEECAMLGTLVCNLRSFAV